MQGEGDSDETGALKLLEIAVVSALFNFGQKEVVDEKEKQQIR